MIFVPKIRFIQKGLPAGVSVGQSIFKKNGGRQQNRSSALASPEVSKVSGPSGDGPIEERSGRYREDELNTADRKSNKSGVDLSESKLSPGHGLLTPKVTPCIK